MTLTIVKTASAPLAEGDQHITSHVTNYNIEKNYCCGRGEISLYKSILTTHHPSLLDWDLTAQTLRTGLTSADVFFFFFLETGDNGGRDWLT